MTDPVPAGQRLIPHLVVGEAAPAIDFYQRAFGAVVTLRLDEPSGRIGHAELAIDGAGFMLAGEYPELEILGPLTRGGATALMTLYVADVDAFVQRAVAAGAELVRPVIDEFYGDRVGQLRDPFGHRWSIHTRREDVSPEEMKRRFAAMFAGS